MKWVEIERKSIELWRKNLNCLALMMMQKFAKNYQNKHGNQTTQMGKTGLQSLEISRPVWWLSKRLNTTPTWQVCGNCNTIITQVNILLVLPHYNKTSATLLLVYWLFLLCSLLLTCSCLIAATCKTPHCTSWMSYCVPLSWNDYNSTDGSCSCPNYMCSNSTGEQCTLYSAGKFSRVRNLHHRHCKMCVWKLPTTTERDLIIAFV